MITNISLEELLKLWAKTTCLLFTNVDKKQEKIKVRNDFGYQLSKKGVKDLEIFNIDGDECIIRYYYQGSKVTKHISLK